MFAPRRGRLSLLVPLALAVAFGYVLAGGIGSAVGALLFLPFLLMKVMFTMLLFGFVFKMFAHRSGFAPHRPSRNDDRPQQTEPEDSDWEEALRAAKREIDRLFPNPDDTPSDRKR